jgi:hypothetical protein
MVTDREGIWGDHARPRRAGRPDMGSRWPQVPMAAHLGLV